MSIQSIQVSRISGEMVALQSYEGSAAIKLIREGDWSSKMRDQIRGQLRVTGDIALKESRKVSDFYSTQHFQTAIVVSIAACEKIEKTNPLLESDQIDICVLMCLETFCHIKLKDEACLTKTLDIILNMGTKITLPIPVSAWAHTARARCFLGAKTPDLRKAQHHSELYLKQITDMEKKYEITDDKLINLIKMIKFENYINLIFVHELEGKIEESKGYLFKATALFPDSSTLKRIKEKLFT